MVGVVFLFCFVLGCFGVFSFQKNKKKSRFAALRGRARRQPAGQVCSPLSPVGAEGVAGGCVGVAPPRSSQGEGAGDRLTAHRS